MENQSESLQLFLNNIIFSIPYEFNSFIKVSRNIKKSFFFNGGKYFVQSKVRNEIFRFFLDCWVEEKDLEVNADNIWEYYLLSNEFNLFKNVVSNPEYENILQLSCLIYLTKENQDERTIDMLTVERYISRHLDYYLDKYQDKMHDIPLNSLYNIFFHQERKLENEDKAYQFITGYSTTNTMNDINNNNNNTNSKFGNYILLQSLDCLKMSRANGLDAHTRINEHCGFLPKNSSMFFKILDDTYSLKEQENESIKEKLKKLTNCIEEFPIEELTDERITSLCEHVTKSKNIKDTVNQYLPFTHEDEKAIDSNLSNLIDDSNKLKELLEIYTGEEDPTSERLQDLKEQFNDIKYKAKKDKSLSEEVQNKLNEGAESSEILADSLEKLQCRSTELDNKLEEIENLNFFLRRLASTIEGVPLEEVKAEELTNNKIDSLCDTAKNSKDIKDTVNKHLPESRDNNEAIDSNLTKIIDESNKLKELLEALTGEENLTPEQLEELKAKFNDIKDKAKKDMSLSEELQKQLPDDSYDVESISSKLESLQQDSDKLKEAQEELRRLASTIEGVPLEEVKAEELTNDKIDSLCGTAKNSKDIKDTVNKHLPESKDNYEAIDYNLTKIIDESKKLKELLEALTGEENLTPEQLEELKAKFNDIKDKAKKDMSLSEELQKQLPNDSYDVESISSKLESLQQDSDKLKEAQEELRRLASTIEGVPLEEVKAEELTNDKIDSLCGTAKNSKDIKDTVNKHLPESKDNYEAIDYNLTKIIDESKKLKELLEALTGEENLTPEQLEELKAKFNDIKDKAKKDMSLSEELQKQLPDDSYDVESISSKLESLQQDSDKLKEAQEELRRLASTIEGVPLEEVKAEELTNNKIDSLCDTAKNSKDIKDTVNKHLPESKDNYEAIDYNLTKIIDESNKLKELLEALTGEENLTPEQLEELKAKFNDIKDKAKKDMSLSEELQKQLPDDSYDVESISSKLESLQQDSDKLKEAQEELRRLASTIEGVPLEEVKAEELTNDKIDSLCGTAKNSKDIKDTVNKHLPESKDNYEAIDYNLTKIIDESKKLKELLEALTGEENLTPEQLEELKAKFNDIKDKAKKDMSLSEELQKQLPNDSYDVESISSKLESLQQDSDKLKEAQEELRRLASTIEGVPLEEVKAEELTNNKIDSLCDTAKNSKDIKDTVNKHLPESKDNYEAIDYNLTKIIDESKKLKELLEALTGEENLTPEQLEELKAKFNDIKDKAKKDMSLSEELQKQLPDDSYDVESISSKLESLQQDSDKLKEAQEELRKLASTIEGVPLEEVKAEELTNDKIDSLCDTAKISKDIKYTVNKHLPESKDNYEAIDSNLTKIIDESNKLKELLEALTGEENLTPEQLEELKAKFNDIKDKAKKDKSLSEELQKQLPNDSNDVESISSKLESLQQDSDKLKEAQEELRKLASTIEGVPLEEVKAEELTNDKIDSLCGTAKNSKDIKDNVNKHLPESRDNNEAIDYNLTKIIDESNKLKELLETLTGEENLTPEQLEELKAKFNDIKDKAKKDKSLSEELQKQLPNDSNDVESISSKLESLQQDSDKLKEAQEELRRLASTIEGVPLEEVKAEELTNDKIDSLCDTAKISKDIKYTVNKHLPESKDNYEAIDYNLTKIIDESNKLKELLEALTGEENLTPEQLEELKAKFNDIKDKAKKDKSLSEELQKQLPNDSNDVESISSKLESLQQDSDKLKEAQEELRKLASTIEGVPLEEVKAEELTNDKIDSLCDTAKISKDIKYTVNKHLPESKDNYEAIDYNLTKIIDESKKLKELLEALTGEENLTPEQLEELKAKFNDIKDKAIIDKILSEVYKKLTEGADISEMLEDSLVKLQIQSTELDNKLEEIEHLKFKLRKLASSIEGLPPEEIKPEELTSDKIDSLYDIASNSRTIKYAVLRHLPDTNQDSETIDSYLTGIFGEFQKFSELIESVEEKENLTSKQLQKLRQQYSDIKALKDRIFNREEVDDYLVILGISDNLIESKPSEDRNNYELNFNEVSLDELFDEPQELFAGEATLEEQNTIETSNNEIHNDLNEEEPYFEKFFIESNDIETILGHHTEMDQLQESQENPSNMTSCIECLPLEEIRDDEFTADKIESLCDADTVNIYLPDAHNNEESKESNYNLTKELEEVKVLYHTLSQELDKFKDLNYALTTELNEAKASIDHLTIELNESKSSNDCLIKELGEAKESNDWLNKEFEEVKTCNTNLTKELELAKDSYYVLSKELDESKASNDKLRKELEIITKVDDNL